MTDIRLIRHGEISLNKNRTIITGRSVTQKLTKRGIEQASMLGEFYLQNGVHPDAAFSSDTARNRQTGGLVLGLCAPDLELTFLEGLQEISLGSYEGMARDIVYTPEVIAQIHRELFDFKLPGTESMRDVAERAKQAIFQIAKTHPDKVIFAFTHYLTISCLAGLELGWSHSKIRSVDIDNCSETKLYSDGESLDFEYVGKQIIAN